MALSRETEGRTFQMQHYLEHGIEIACRLVVIAIVSGVYARDVPRDIASRIAGFHKVVFSQMLHNFEHLDMRCDSRLTYLIPKPSDDPHKRMCMQFYIAAHASNHSYDR